MRNAFPSKLKTIEDAPGPFGRPLRSEMSPSERIELLVYAPPYTFGASRAPGALLAITDKRWLVAVADDEGDVSAVVLQSDYANTLLVEMTTILLYGCLKIDFAAGDGKAQSVRIYFNTVMDHLLQHAAQLLLDKMDGVSEPPPPTTHKMPDLLEPLPMKFQSAILRATPEGERLQELVHCSVVLGRKRLWFQRELAPETVLSLTDRELMLVADERGPSWLKRAEGNYGSIVTHCPLSRFAGFRIERREGVATLTLKTHAAIGGETFQIDFPPDKAREVIALLEHAVTRNHA